MSVFNKKLHCHIAERAAFKRSDFILEYLTIGIPINCGDIEHIPKHIDHLMKNQRHIRSLITIIIYQLKKYTQN